MSDAAYNAAPGLRWSDLAPALTSGLQLAHHLRQPRADRPAFALGRAAHVAVLQPERLLGWPMVPPEHLTPSGSLSTKADTKAWMADMVARGVEPMGQADLNRALAIQVAVGAHPVASATLAQCVRREVPVYAKADGVDGKACPDAYDPATGLLVDMKTTSSRGSPVTVRSCVAAIVRYHYAGQLAWYSRVMRAAGLAVGDWRIIFVDTSAPHDVFVLELGPEWQEYGDELVDKALAVRAEVLAGKVEGQAPALVSAELPDYLRETETGTDLDFGEEGDDA